ncbi:histidine kinase [Romboutsia ilealis]|uniref:histidine kinase n=1 Tax=Romboutsia faecis TaxID=2764597 RepID=A0ABR7JLP6_9FIRM|nr:sensor histidine kinase [Romboutsia faecis]MBC5995526.1 histidine kinase [Romboutsia faecis]MRN23726.1 histidine kinase [Romboutsia ilealis]
MIDIKKSLKNIFLTIISILTLSSEHAYATSYNDIIFKSLTIENGLSQSTVETILQDSNGYIWIGTNDGLNKYNGYSFKKYEHDIYNKNTISSNYIVDIIEDQDGYIWVSTTNGLNKINPKDDTIINYFTTSKDKSLSNNRICEILVRKNNDILVTTSDGLNLYNKDTDSFERILGNKNDLPSQYIHSIEEDYYENIWLGTQSGLVKLDKNLTKIQEFTNKTVESISDNPIYRVYSDGPDNIWVATLGSGLININSKTNDIKTYKNNNSKKSLPNDVVRDILRDSNGNLWIVTQGGICKYNESDDNFTTYKNKIYNQNSLIDDKAYCIIEDKSGLMWVGTYKGISLFDSNNKFEHYSTDPFDKNSLSSNMIHGIYEDSINNIWVGTSIKGVNIIDKKTNNIKILSTENSDLCNDSIADITGTKNEIFIGTAGGLSVINQSSKSIENFTTKDGLPVDPIKSLFIDSTNHLWIGTNKGLAIMDINTKKILNITHVLENNSINDLFIKDIYESKNGNYYIGCFLDGGLVQLNPIDNSIKVYKNIENDNSSISNNSIRSISEDNLGNLLVGTSHGLNILDVDSGKFKHYTTNDGLPNNTIYGILVDSYNHIWMSTNSGLSKFNPSTEVFQNFTIIDGIQSNEFNGNAYFKANDGKFYFGGINGLNAFFPEKIDVSEFTPNVIFDEFKVEGLSYDTTSNYDLESNENNISLSFFVNDYKNLNGVQYYYMLEGSDENWNISHNNEIIYGNLSPGNYTFKVKALNYNGVMSPENKISFTIKPPFWKSNLAIYIYIIIFLIAIYFNRSKVKRLDKLVEKRTEELVYEMNKNKKLFNKLIKLEVSKNNYFVNLSHELRTPLNVLNGTSQLIKDFNKKGEIEPNKLDYYMDIMTRNCNRLLNIINNIIDTSKLQSDNYIITKKNEDIVYIVEETILGLKDYIESKGIEFTIDTMVEEKVIECDKYEIERCIVNLIGNAVKFTPKGGKIDVLINDLDSAVEIRIKDTGIGISKENQLTIFNKFNQVLDSNSESKGGSGLGLTITKHLIELHNGQISVKSKLGEGSEFIIILPTNSNENIN